MIPSRVRRDPFLWALGAIGVVYVLLYSLPILGGSAMEVFAAWIAETVLLVLVVAVPSVGLRRVRHIEARRFWLLITACFASWLAGSLLEIASEFTPVPGSVSQLVKPLFLFSFLFFVLATDQRPHLRSGWSRDSLAYRFSAAGSVLFVLALLTYFYLIPAVYEGGSKGFGRPATMLVISLDALIAVRLVHLATICGRGRWRLAYSLLALAATFWMATDTIKFLIQTGRLELPYGTAWDFLWYLPLVLVVIVRRAVVAEESATAERPPFVASSLAEFWRRDVPDLLLIYALLFPAFHLVLAELGMLEPETRGARQGLVLACLLAFIGLAVIQQRRLLRRNQELRSTIAVLVTSEQQQQAQKMEATGRLAGGVAHDLNNLLTVLQSHGSILLDGMREDDPLRGNVAEIEKASERAGWLTRQLLAFSRGQVLEPRPVDLNAVVRDARSMLRHLIGETVEVETFLRDGLGRVEADPGQILQVLINLGANARDAMPDGGRLTITTSEEWLAEADVEARAGIDPGPHIILSVSDTGVGMDEDVQSQVFEPFFTRKQGGTGLGLATVYGIVTQSRGHIRLWSRRGGGTTFKIYLPRIEEQVETAPSVDSRTESRPALPNTVLLVEDQPTVREAVRELLEALDLEVLEAGGGAEALTVAAGHDGDIGLLVTDIVMPGMNGWDLARRMRSARQDLPILYMSGYADPKEDGGDFLGRGAVFLQKPFGLNDLCGALDTLMGTEVPSARSAASRDAS